MSRSSQHATWIGILALGAGCAQLDSRDASRIEITEANDLGATTIEVDRFIDDGGDVFELRGFDAGDRELASVRLRTGVISDIHEWLPGTDDLGTELTVTIGGVEQRMVSRELELFRLDEAEDPAAQQFLELHAVSTALKGASIIVPPHAEGSLAPAGERAFDALLCSNWNMLATPVAKQCCEGGPTGPLAETTSTKHVNPTGAVVRRDYGNACKAADGFSPCSGSACYYGPFGFSRPVLTTPSGSTPYAKNKTQTYQAQGATGQIYCSTTYSASPPVPEFGNVTGTQSNGVGCPGGTSGAGLWDY